MSLSDNLREYISACFTGLWVESHEHPDALTEMAELCREETWRLATWDIEQGLQIPGQETTESGGSDPLAAIRSINALASPESSAILVLQNFHKFLNSPEIIQAVARQVIEGRQNRTFLIVLSPVVSLPVELEKLFTVIEHEMPSRQQLEDIARGVATEEGELPEGASLEAVLDASMGLTRFEAENAYSLSLVRHSRVTPEAVWQIKAGALKKSGMVGLHRGGERFEQLGGLENLKAFCLRAMRRQGHHDPLRRPKGVMLLSPPGCGKSQFAKALGNEVGRPTLTLDVGRLLGSLVGQSESNMRQALRITDAMSPCILFCDEIEKALSGVASSGQTDSGVSARLFGNLLSWLNDRTSDVFFIGTCNDISKLPPEFARAERTDGVFFIDLPNPEQREAIWQIYLEQFGLDADQRRPQDEGWTGAEIKSCCRLASLLDVPLLQAAQNIVPISATAGEAVQRLREWATGRCLSADVPGIYEGNGTRGKKARRSIPRDPSQN
ncbi:MAG: AAA family ATPase [Planctomycetaceae bacterium]|nr:AAA family ATPase [Planctomycetaceae bacterium]